MLLETLDVRNNDVVIYSENNPDLENNFKIIFKQGVSRKPMKLSFSELCEFLTDPSPKNLIIYRLLTNYKILDPFLSKYGCFLNNNGKKELFYFDPVYAVKDLKYLADKLDKENFRFKIQQVGLTTMTEQKQEIGYSEVFCIDLKAIEAKNQNDKIFADAVFVFDPTYNDDEDLPTFGAEDLAEKTPNVNLIGLEEVEKAVDTSVAKIDVEEEKISKNDLTEKSKSKKTGAFSNFIQKHKVEMEELNKTENSEETNEESGLDLFNRKNMNKKRVLREDTVILKFNDD